MLSARLFSQVRGSTGMITHAKVTHIIEQSHLIVSSSGQLQYIFKMNTV